MNRYKHILFNPHIENGLEGVLKMVDDTWSLSHPVWISEYQAVAVFERWDSEGELKEEKKK